MVQRLLTTIPLELPLAALSATILGGLLVAGPGPRRMSSVSTSSVPPPVVELREEAAVTRSASPAHQEAPPPDRRPVTEVALVLAAGDSYLALAPDVDRSIAHGTPRLHDSGAVAVASARIAADQVPAEHAPWLGREVVVDETCRARVTGFAIVARIDGYPSYVGGEDDDRWTAAEVFEHGARTIAARLSGCHGTLARAVESPPIVRFVDEKAPRALVAAGRSRLLASPRVEELQTQWRDDFAGQGAWHAQPDVTFGTRLVRHPQTGARWLLVTVASELGCGSLGANVLGVYRVGSDGSLETHVEREEVLTTIDSIVDIDGDGAPELVGHDWLSTGYYVMPAATPTDAPVAEVQTAFAGCPC